MRRPLSAIVALALLTQPVAGQPDDYAPAAPVPATAGDPAVAEPLYQPQDNLERGLWMQVAEAERELRHSPQVIRDPALNAYVRNVLCRVAGEDKCRNIRLYIVRTPYFNASMAPNGMMEVWSGLLLRAQNEAQLAAVLGHEYTHFENRHSVKLYRDLRSKANAAGWLAMTGLGLIASVGMLASIFSYSREMEREADHGGLDLMARAGYDTREAAVIWERLRAEMDATAASRNTKSRKDRDRGIFESHPPSAERVRYLTEAAAARPGTPGETGADHYVAAMADFWPLFVEDQLKMNDFGASDYLITSLASSGWTAPLLYARGELYRRHAAPGDLEKADGFYGEGIATQGALPELWRGRGLVRLKLGRTDAGQADLQEYLRRAPQASDRAMIATLAGGQ